MHVLLILDNNLSYFPAKPQQVVTVTASLHLVYNPLSFFFSDLHSLFNRLIHNRSPPLENKLCLTGSGLKSIVS